MRMKTLKVKVIGEDFWGRKLFQNVNAKHRIYAKVDGVLHTTTHMGEPDCPILNKIQVMNNEL